MAIYYQLTILCAILTYRNFRMIQRSYAMIAILMATYNGAQFIAQQIESILAQTVQDFVLYIQDDLSTDGTWNILQDFAKNHPERINISQNHTPSGGAGNNFFSLMQKHQSSRYVMLCDQDDVWLPDKIAKTLAKMRELEKTWGADTPLLVHTDCTVVDEALKTIAPSYRKLALVDPSRSALKDVVIQNMLTGCTALYNRKLAALLKEKPEHMVMHDWWLSLVGSAFGHLGYVEDATLLYRQHRHNAIGVRNLHSASFLARFSTQKKAIQAAIRATYPQASAFLAIYRTQLSDDNIQLLAEYAEIPNQPKLKRWLQIIRLGCYKTGLLRNVAYFIYV